MASALLKKKTQRSDWTNTGSFLHKPARGWLHPDEQLSPDAGVCYGVRYIGNQEVNTSMKTLDFETRTAVTKESISRVCELAGLKNATKKSKRSSKVKKYLSGEPQMENAGTNVNLTITTDSISVVAIETTDLIGSYEMPGISFASGGDPDTIDFVAFVAKDTLRGRCCYVLECGGGLAQDVITTIGQAFELRFKLYLSNQPRAIPISDRDKSGNEWGEDGEYYNDRVGAQPPSPNDDRYCVKPSNIEVSDGMYAAVLDPPESNGVVTGNLLDLDNVYDNTKQKGGGGMSGIVYDNPNHIFDEARFDDAVYDNTSGANHHQPVTQEHRGQPQMANGIAPTNPKPALRAVAHRPLLDDFQMAPFQTEGAVSMEQNPTVRRGPYNADWFHGQLTRQQADQMLVNNGDFLVRESINSPGQFVLSGMHEKVVKHLLLVDPAGIVRTKDREFDSVEHLVNYHMNNGLPIISQEHELVLLTPVVHSPC